MTVVMVVARERTEYWRPSSPTSAEIDAAFRSVNVGSWGRWVGASPRIVRHVYDFTNAASNQYGIYTYAAQPFEIAPAMEGHATYVLQQLLAALDGALARASSNPAWELSTVAVYDPARNGPLTWWSGGQARQTNTRDLNELAFVSFRANNRENPIGPAATTPAQPGAPLPDPTRAGSGPQTLPEVIDEAASSGLRKWAPWLILGGVLLFGVVFLPEIMGAARARRSAARVVFENPRPKRRRRNPRGRTLVTTVDALTAERLGIDAGYRREMRAITRDEARRQHRAIVVKGPSGRVLLEAEPNPTPAVWKVAQPGTAYECASPLVGQVVPGRGGGRVRACATPSKKKPREGQVYLVDPKGQTLAGFGETMPKSRAARRIRDASKPRATPLELSYLSEAHEGYRATGIPRPTGLEFPHVAGSSPCDPEARVWRGFLDSLEAAEERASIQAEDGDQSDYERALFAALKRDPRFHEWDKTAKACAADFDARQRRKKPKAASVATERGALMREYRELGEGAFVERHGAELSEVLDTLTEGYKKRPAAKRAPARKISAPRRKAKSAA